MTPNLWFTLGGLTGVGMVGVLVGLALIRSIWKDEQAAYDRERRKQEQLELMAKYTRSRSHPAAHS